jgi:hypothetical protein
VRALPRHRPQDSPPTCRSSTIRRVLTRTTTKLADLRDRGVLTDAEFEAQKAKLLAAG